MSRIDAPLSAGEIKPKIEGETWDVVGNGVTSDDIKNEVPGLAIDPLSIKGAHVLTYAKLFHPREINNRRIAARARRQRLEREKAGLFADEVAAEQKDPREELEELECRRELKSEQVDHRAREKWLANFRELAKKSPEDQAKLAAAWNASSGPKDHAYFAGWLKKADLQGLAQKVTDRSDIADSELRSRVERMDKTWRTLKDIERAANPDSPFNLAPQRLAEEKAKYDALGIQPPRYESDKPSWDQLQAEKEAKLEARRKAEQEQKAKETGSLLFSPDELIPAIGLERHDGS